MDYITIKEAAEKWGISGRAVTYYIVDGRIPGALKKGNLWLIPSSAPKPADGRKNNRRQPRKTENSNFPKNGASGHDKT